MSEEADDLYDDEDDDEIFQEEYEEGEAEEAFFSEEEDDILDEEYEEYDSDEDEDYDDEDEDLAYEDEENGHAELSSCFVCSQSCVAEEDRWKFAVSDEDGDREEFWACKSCREKFASLKDFEEFRTNWPRASLYRCAATLQRLILLKAPDCIVAQAAFVLAGCLFSEGSGNLALHGADELNKLKGRIGGEG